MARAWHRAWRLNVLVIFSLLLGTVGLFAGPAAAADNGTVISNGTGPNHRPGIGISPDSNRVCVVWSNYDQSANQAYARHYFPETNTWSPDLSQPAVEVSRDAGGSALGNTVRCTIDSSGRTHMIWGENPGAQLRYSQLPPNADPSNLANWSNPITIATAGEGWDSQNPDIAIVSDNGGRVWLVYWSLDNSGVFVRSWSSGGWSASTMVSPSGSKHPRIGVDNAGNVHVIYIRSGAGLRYSYRDVNTGLWTQDVQLPGGGDAVEQSGIAVNRDSGDVHIVYSAGTSCGGSNPDNCRVVRYVKKTGPTGTSFSGPLTLTDTGNHVVTRIAWSAAGKLTMVSDKRDAGVITFATSDNNGSSWSGANDLTDNLSAQWPAVAMDNAGNGYVVYWSGADIRFIRRGNLPNTPQTPRCTPFVDVAEADTECNAIRALTGNNVIKGYDPSHFGPNDPVLRAQMAAFIVRGLGWGNRSTGPKTFNDFGPLVGELRDASLILANSCDRSGTNCVAQGYTATTFAPNNAVTYAQVMTFISRAFVQDANYGWTSPATVGQPYSGVPSVHDQDVRVYEQNAGRITGVPVPDTEAGWNSPAPRDWVAFVLYQALQSNTP